LAKVEKRKVEMPVSNKDFGANLKARKKKKKPLKGEMQREKGCTQL